MWWMFLSGLNGALFYVGIIAGNYGLAILNLIACGVSMYNGIQGY